MSVFKKIECSYVTNRVIEIPRSTLAFEDCLQMC